MSDKELLERAARAAGIALGDWYGDTYQTLHDTPQDTDGFLWNPLTNDGDALRLAVILHLDINVYPKSGEVGAVWHNSGKTVRRCFETVTNDDWATATRRAIVRAAAELAT